MSDEFHSFPSLAWTKNFWAWISNCFLFNLLGFKIKVLNFHFWFRSSRVSVSMTQLLTHVRWVKVVKNWVSLVSLFFWFELFLEARAEILEKISLVFWSKWWHVLYPCWFSRCSDSCFTALTISNNNDWLMIDLLY